MTIYGVLGQEDSEGEDSFYESTSSRSNRKAIEPLAAVSLYNEQVDDTEAVAS